MADVATVFGSINSVIDQTTNSILKIEAANNAYKGNVPTMYAGAFPNSFALSSYTTQQKLGIGLLVLVGAAVAYMLYKEFK